MSLPHPPTDASDADLWLLAGGTTLAVAVLTLSLIVPVRRLGLRLRPTYRLGDVYYCTISSADPGARITRADGSTRHEAEQRAIEKATRYLGQTRRFSTA